MIKIVQVFAFSSFGGDGSENNGSQMEAKIMEANGCLLFRVTFNDRQMAVLNTVEETQCNPFRTRLRLIEFFFMSFFRNFNKTIKFESNKN